MSSVKTIIGDLTGMVFTNLTILSHVSGNRGYAKYIASCACGGERIIKASDICRRDSRAIYSCCGMTAYQLKYGHKRKNQHPAYYIWAKMKERCSNASPKNMKTYKNYGGRGIAVCEEWQEWEPFMLWADSNGYGKGLEIDRIDVNGNYCPENCRWTTKRINRQNKRNTRWVLFGKDTLLPLADASVLFRVSNGYLRSRLARGWTLDQALLGYRREDLSEQREPELDAEGKYVYHSKLELPQATPSSTS